MIPKSIINIATIHFNAVLNCLLFIDNHSSVVAHALGRDVHLLACGVVVELDLSMTLGVGANGWIPINGAYHLAPV